MNNTTGSGGFRNIWVILGGIIIAVVATGLVVAFLSYMHTGSQLPQAPDQPVFTVVPAETLTPIITLPVENTPTPTPVPPGTIGIGVYVRVTGTNGNGLRLRAKPGTSNPMLFLGMELEVFQVKDGPIQADNFTWWYLQAPYDKNRSGWAVQDYLTALQNP